MQTTRSLLWGHGRGGVSMSELRVMLVPLDVAQRGRQPALGWGLCPYHAWSEKSLNAPRARSGALMVDIPDGLVPGISIRITSERWPVAVDHRSGWVRLGPDEAGDEAVESPFGCIRVACQIRDEGAKSISRASLRSLRPAARPALGRARRSSAAPPRGSARCARRAARGPCSGWSARPRRSSRTRRCARP